MAKDKSPEQPTCFVIMPISDVENYDVGHFGRVYEYIIKPACLAAGFKPIRADEVQSTNYIVVDILRKILDAEMVVCDLSSRNPNVLYELGIRQAFNLPVTLIRDSRTPRIFDIQGLRDIEYDESLRIDKINNAVEILTNTLNNNSELNEEEVNSIIQLLGIKPATTPSIEVSKDTSLLLDAIKNIGEKLSTIEAQAYQSPLARGLGKRATLISQENENEFIFAGKNFDLVSKGDRVRHPELGEATVTSIKGNMMSLLFDNGAVMNIKPGGTTMEKIERINS